MSIRNSGRGVGLPPPAKFRPSMPMPREDPEDSEFGSDMDETTDSEGGRYSQDSSPRKTSNRYGGYPASYVSDGTYSDFSSTMEVSKKKMQGGTGGVNRYPIGEQDYTSDNESVDSVSASSSEVESGHVVRGNPPVYSDAYSSGVATRVNAHASAPKDFRVKAMQNRILSDDDIATAPPILDSDMEANQGVGKNLGSRSDPTRADGNRNDIPVEKNPDVSTNMNSAVGAHVITEKKSPDQNGRNVGGVEAPVSLSSLPARQPTFHASAQGPWCAVIAYDACVRLCLHLWARGCIEAPVFLENECELLRNAFGLQKVLLQSEEELLAKRSAGLTSEGGSLKPKKVVGKMKVQVRKVKMALDPPTGCSSLSVKLPIIKTETLRHFTNLSSGCRSLAKVRVAPRVPANGSLSRQSLAYVSASTQYIKQVSVLLKGGVTTLRNTPSSYEVVQEKYSCLMRLKSSTEGDAVRMPPGSGETHVFFPDSLGDDLIIEVQDSKGKYYGRVLAQLATITENLSDKLRWWAIYSEPEHELVGKLQLHINYSTTADEASHLKCGSVAETVAYDMVLEVAMKIQHFQQRSLLLHDPWKWLLTEFAGYYGVSEAYTKLRYLSYVMDVATPTADCLILVHDLLLPVITKGHSKSTLSHQENRILGEIEDQIEQILVLVFENYKSLDESKPSGMMDVFRPAAGSPAPALAPAIKLFTCLHDILTPEAQSKLLSYFQAAAKKRSRRHLVETDEFVTNNNEATLMDPMILTTSYQKMKSLCLNFRNEVSTDIDIHNHHVLPSFIDLPNISSAIYSVELCNRLRTFLVACPPPGPSPPVVDLVIAAADFQRDLLSWNISSVKGGVEAKELFHLYIILWIQDKRLSLLESCKLDKVKWSGVKTQHSTTPFVDDMYDRLRNTLNEYENIVNRWPEYTFALENAIADVEKAIVEALERQYADVISPLKDSMAPKKFGFKYIQKLAKRADCMYTVPDELGILLNSMKRMLDVLRPRIENQLKSWGSCIPSGGNAVPGERLSEITVMLRAKFRNYLQAVVEKLSDNSRLQSSTKLKKIIQDSKDPVVESDVRTRMQPLKDQLSNTIDHLHTVFETHVFLAICRGYWDRMGQDVLSFLANRKENRVWYKGSRITTSILDDTFASQMQQLLGNALLDKDLEPPRSIMEVRSILCKDAPNHKDSNYYY